MDVQRDFADLCSLLNAKAVEFLIVGAMPSHFTARPALQVIWIS